MIGEDKVDLKNFLVDAWRKYQSKGDSWHKAGAKKLNSWQHRVDSWVADQQDRTDSWQAQQQKANQQPVYEGYQRPGEPVSTAFDVGPSHSLAQFRETIELANETIFGIPLSDEVRGRIEARATEEKRFARRKRIRVPLREKHINRQLEVVSTPESREAAGENSRLRNRNKVTMELLVEVTNMPLYNPDTGMREVEDSENIWQWKDDTKTVAQLINRETGEIIQYMDKTGMYSSDGVSMP